MSQQYHYFSASLFNWAVADSLESVLKKQRLADKKSKPKPKSCTVFYVPVPIDQDYDIEYFTPQVPGTVVVTEVRYDDFEPKMPLKAPSMESMWRLVETHIEKIDKGTSTEIEAVAVLDAVSSLAHKTMILSGLSRDPVTMEYKRLRKSIAAHAESRREFEAYDED